MQREKRYKLTELKNTRPLAMRVMSNGGHRSTFAGNIALQPSDVIDFLQCFPLGDFGGKQFYG